MPTVAEQLRCAREQLNLNVYEIAEITKLKTDHVRALESGDYDVFSAPVYIRGFVRTYARAVKLDEARLAADLEAELSKTTKFCEPPPLTKQKRTVLDAIMLQFSKMNWRVGVALLGIVIFLAVGGTALRHWHQSSKADPLRNLGAGLYQSKSGSAGEMAPLPTTNSPTARHR